MLFNLRGRQKISFANAQGELIEGENWFVSYLDESVEGEKTEKFFVKPEVKIPAVTIGDKVNIYFNQKGRVEAITK